MAWTRAVGLERRSCAAIRAAARRPTAWSCHQHAELAFDQTVATWLACHQHTFEYFGGGGAACEAGRSRGTMDVGLFRAVRVATQTDGGAELLCKVELLDTRHNRILAYSKNRSQDNNNWAAFSYVVSLRVSHILSGLSKSSSMFW